MFSNAMNSFYLKSAFSHATFKGLVLGIMLLKLVTIIAIQLTLKFFLKCTEKVPILRGFFVYCSILACANSALART
ncbi:hypothetical protein IDM32_11745 [Acinetobacter seifertii]|nr:hypothetical protein [Acinetobacter seifertii]